VDMYRETTRVTADDWLIWTQSVDRHVKLITFCFFLCELLPRYMCVFKMDAKL
jgi:hypothetical protein